METPISALEVLAHVAALHGSLHECIVCSISAVSGTQQNLKLFLTLDAHYGHGQAARILSLVLASSMAGRLLMVWLADRFPKKYVMLSSTCLLPEQFHSCL